MVGRKDGGSAVNLVGEMGNRRRLGRAGMGA